MIRALPALAVGLLFAASLPAQTPPVVKAIAISPDPANRLASGQDLNVRVAYESSQPLRFQASGYYQGKQNVHLATNPSPLYPAGKGEAIVWLFGQPGARLDELHVRVNDADWKELFELAMPFPAEWHAGLPRAPEAPWVKQLNDAQQQAVQQALQNPPAPAGWLRKIWVTFATALVPLAFLSVPGYPLLQLYAFYKLRGPARLLSALPLSFMLPVYGYCLYALSRDSNLWPLFALFASPVALLITLAVLLISLRRQQTAAIAP